MWFHSNFNTVFLPSYGVVVYLQGRTVACKGQYQTAHNHFNVSCEMINEVYSYNKSKPISPQGIKSVHIKFTYSDLTTVFFFLKESFNEDFFLLFKKIKYVFNGGIYLTQPNKSA